MKKILLLDILNHPEFSFTADCIETLKIAAQAPIEVSVVFPARDNCFESNWIDEYSGIIVTGSITRYCENVPWIQSLSHFIIEVFESRKIPLLGICMVHQLIAKIFGGKVERHPSRRELGTIGLELTDDGMKSPLFEGLATNFKILSSHYHDVIEPPRCSKVLAFNERGPCQAFSLKNLFGVQFHPEVNADVMRRWLLTYGSTEELIEQGYLNSKQQLDNFLHHKVYDTFERFVIFRNFIKICENKSFEL